MKEGEPNGEPRPELSFSDVKNHLIEAEGHLKVMDEELVRATEHAKKVEELLTANLEDEANSNPDHIADLKAAVEHNRQYSAEVLHCRDSYRQSVADLKKLEAYLTNLAMVVKDNEDN